jgi:hypothetical protein
VKTQRTSGSVHAVEGSLLMHEPEYGGRCAEWHVVFRNLFTVND